MERQTRQLRKDDVKKKSNLLRHVEIDKQNDALQLQVALAFLRETCAEDAVFSMSISAHDQLIVPLTNILRSTSADAGVTSDDFTGDAVAKRLMASGQHAIQVFRVVRSKPTRR